MVITVHCFFLSSSHHCAIWLSTFLSATWCQCNYEVYCWGIAETERHYYFRFKSQLILYGKHHCTCIYKQVVVNTCINQAKFVRELINLKNKVCTLVYVTSDCKDYTSIMDFNPQDVGFAPTEYALFRQMYYGSLCITSVHKKMLI